MRLVTIAVAFAIAASARAQDGVALNANPSWHRAPWPCPVGRADDWCVFYTDPHTPIALRPHAVTGWPAGSYVFLSGVTTAVVLAGAFHLDPDRGGYRDTWHTRDKAEHALLSFAATELGVRLKTNRWLAAGAVTLAGVGYEIGQGHVSHLDILANALGAGLSVLLHARHRR
jgi:hypothetical protein